MAIIIYDKNTDIFLLLVSVGLIIIVRKVILFEMEVIYYIPNLWKNCTAHSIKMVFIVGHWYTYIFSPFYSDVSN